LCSLLSSIFDVWFVFPFCVSILFASMFVFFFCIWFFFVCVILFVCQFVCLSFHLFVCFCLFLFVCFNCFSLFVYLFVFLLFVCVFAGLFVFCLFVCFLWLTIPFYSFQDHFLMKRLMTCVLSALKAEGCNGVFSEVCLNNHDAIESYCRLGFYEIQLKETLPEDTIYYGRSF